MGHNHIEDEFSARGLIRGGTLFLDRDVAIAMIERARIARVPVLGIDGFRLTHDATEPSMDNSLDFTIGDTPVADTWTVAATFVRERPDGLIFEVVLDKRLAALSGPSIIWRAGAAIASLTIGSWMIDAKGAEALAPALRVVAMFVLILYGVATAAQILRALLGLPTIRWFPQTTSLWRANGLVAFLATSTLILGVVFTLGAIVPGLGWRPAVAGLGTLFCFVALARTRGFWNNPEVEALRELMGDRAVQFIYAGLGLFAIGVAFFATV
jgi:hypothetical protein